MKIEGLTVNVLPKRSSLLEHLADVRNHRCLVGGDSLPMHFALGTGTRCVSLFTCTSPWEIYDYGIQTKIISPLLEEFFYKRGYDERATTAISVEEVFSAVMRSSMQAPRLRTPLALNDQGMQVRIQREVALDRRYAAKVAVRSWEIEHQIGSSTDSPSSAIRPRPPSSVLRRFASAC